MRETKNQLSEICEGKESGQWAGNIFLKLNSTMMFKSLISKSKCVNLAVALTLTLPSYPSGFVAVCQSHSGLSCGGFYTNVFSDQLSAVTLASITAVGRGTVTHPLR